MAAELLKLDIECHEDGHTKSIRVPIDADQPVRQLLEQVRERSKMNLTELFTVRDGLKALLYPDDLLHLALDEGENRLAAEAEPGTGTVTAEPLQEPAGLSAKASAPPPPSRSRSPARRKPSETARLPKKHDRQRSTNPREDKAFVVKQAFTSGSQDLLSVRPGDLLELAMSRDRGWLACRRVSRQRDVGWVPEWVFREPQKACTQEEDLSDERKEPSSLPAGLRIKGCIRTVTATTGQYVDRMEFRLHSGIHQVYGDSTGGYNTKCFVLERDEAIVEVTHIPTQNYLAQKVKFKTSRGRVFSTQGYGGTDKKQKKTCYAAPEGRQLCGLVFQDAKLVAVAHQTLYKRGSRKHPQKLVPNFMAAFES